MSSNTVFGSGFISKLCYRNTNKQESQENNIIKKVGESSISRKLSSGSSYSVITELKPILNPQDKKPANVFVKMVFGKRAGNANDESTSPLSQKKNSEVNHRVMDTFDTPPTTYNGPTVIDSPLIEWGPIVKGISNVVKGLLVGVFAAVILEPVAALSAVAFVSLIVLSFLCIFPEVREIYPKLLAATGLGMLLLPFAPIVLGGAVGFGVYDKLKALIEGLKA